MPPLRRLLTAGRNEISLDTFMPKPESQVEGDLIWLQALTLTSPFDLSVDVPVEKDRSSGK